MTKLLSMMLVLFFFLCTTAFSENRLDTSSMEALDKSFDELTDGLSDTDKEAFLDSAFYLIDVAVGPSVDAIYLSDDEIMPFISKTLGGKTYKEIVKLVKTTKQEIKNMKIDGRSEKSLEKSIELINSGLSESEKDQLDQSITNITEVFVWAADLKGFTKQEALDYMAEALDGKTYKETIELAKEIEQQMIDAFASK